MKQLSHAMMFLASLSLLSCSLQCARRSSYPFIAGDTFRAIADHIIDETNQSFDPKSVKPYDIIFLKTDYAASFFAAVHPAIPNRYILITHNSDVSPIYLKAMDHPWRGDDMSSYLDDPKLVVWFAQNIDYVHSKLKPLPIGVANRYNPHGNIEVFKAVTRSIPAWENRINKVYLNFALHTNMQERQAALNFFRNRSYADLADFKPAIQYLEEMKQYRYVVNPPGNGLDCHRTWEALMLGCVPIMKHSILDPLFEDLPVILINDWAEVTEGFLADRAAEMAQKNYNLEKIYADYWIALIKSYQR